MLPPVIYQDSSILVIDKPSGLLSVPGRGPELQDCAWARLQSDYPALRVVHRLDRDTSGLLLFALNLESQRELSRQFEQREVVKRYEAWVAGHLGELDGVIDLPLAKDFSAPPRHRVDREHGRPAQTYFERLEQADSATRLTLAPTTGRSHQLRVHLAHIGHPILGDPLYGPPENQTAAPRLMLHASSLEFAHPATGERVRFTSACPF